MENKNIIKRENHAPISDADPIDYKQALQLVIDNLPFDVWMKDLQGRYLAVNKSFVAYAGVPKEAILGATDYDLYPPEEAAIYLASDNAVLNGDRKGYFESIVEGKWKEEYKNLAV